MNIHTDMAVELRETHRLTEQDGFFEETEAVNGISVSRVRIAEGKAAQITGKSPGRYVTVFTEGTDRDDDRFFAAATEISKELKTLLGDVEGCVLAVGIGNPHLTADNLGPAVTDELIVTRHLRQLPDFSAWQLGEVAALKTGVLAQTGMESADLICAAVRQIRPAAVILFDALASRHTDRLCTTVQLADSGISPGSGIGNHRRAIDEETLGVPVLSVGIPTVVRAETLAYDLLTAATGKDDPAAAQALQRHQSDCIVTPSDIDERIAQGAHLIALAANMALHNLTAEEAEALKT